jgi:alcohol dehydrogenase
MRGLVYHGAGKKDWEPVPDPDIIDPTDAIIRVEAVTICGTDLHILKGDVPEVPDGLVLARGRRYGRGDRDGGDHRPAR